jgi:hypothetical protein
MLIDFEEYGATVLRVKAAINCYNGGDIVIVQDQKGQKYLIRKIIENKETMTPFILVESCSE